MHLLASQKLDHADCKRLCENQAFTNILKIRLRAAQPHISLFTSACIERASEDQKRWDEYPDDSLQPYDATKLISLLSTMQERLTYFLENTNLDPDLIPNVTFTTIES